VSGHALGVLILALCASAASRGQSAATAHPFYGKRISEILFSPADQPLSRDQLGLLVRLRPGDVLTEISLARSIEELYLSGRFTNIEVEAEEVNGQIALTFRTTSRYFLSRLSVSGVPEPPNPGRVESALELDLGQPVEDDDVPQAAERLRKVLEANGFYNATIRHRIERREATEEIDILFDVDAGRRVRFTRPDFTGDLKLKEGTLIRRSGWLRWYGLRGYHGLTENRLNKGLENMRGAYLKKEYLLSRVQLSGLSFDPGANQVTPAVEVEAGPQVIVRTEGRKMSRGLLRELIPIYQERTVDRELLNEGRRNLIEHFRNRGYSGPEVSFVREDPLPNGEERITYRIEPGERVKLKAVQIEGEKFFDEETIRERLALQPGGRLSNRYGTFSPAIIERDKEAILQLYEASGFREATVTHEVQEGWEGKERQIAVKLRIDEGRQWLVESIDFSGVDLRLFDTVQQLVTSTPGQPFSAVGVANDRDSILGYYFDNGYPEASLDIRIEPDAGKATAAIKYTVNEGRRYFVRDVLINGPKTTRLDLIRARLAVFPDEPLSQSRLVETQRRLYDLGVFSNVDVAIQNPEGKERSKFVLMQIDEARRYSLQLGFGAELGRIGGGTSFDAPAGQTGVAPRGLIGISRNNFFGLAHTASIMARASNFQQRLLLNYFAPQFLGNDNFNLSFSTFLDRSRDVRTFTSSRIEGTVQFGQRLTRAVTLQYRGSLRRVFIAEGSLNIDPVLIPIFSQPVRTTLFSVGLLQDKRDDPIDSTRGVFNTIDFSYAPQWIGGRTNYTRLLVRNTTYHRIKRNLVFARTVNFGWLQNLDNEFVPLPERFYSGGATTHRGFPENQAGPRDPVTGFPVGGEGFLFLGHELRFPLLGRNLGGVFFHDMGNVYSSLEKFSFRFRQRNLSDFDYAVQAAGFGIRFKTPVGPVRFDLAFSPNTPRFFGITGDREDLLSGRFQFQRQRVSRVQFHFSIGQAF
jgi:outer membrane protein assembly complex protein YaeT